MEVTAEIEGRQFRYFIIPQKLNPSLPNFAVRVTGEKGDGYVLGVADTIPEILRGYVAFHEYIEFVELGVDTPNRCKKALEEELRAVPLEIKKEHSILRSKFFKDLLIYAETEEEMTEEDKEEFRESLRHLERIAQQFL